MAKAGRKHGSRDLAQMSKKTSENSISRATRALRRVNLAAEQQVIREALDGKRAARRLQSLSQSLADTMISGNSLSRDMRETIKLEISLLNLILSKTCGDLKAIDVGQGPKDDAIQGVVLMPALTNEQRNEGEQVIDNKGKTDEEAPRNEESTH